MFDLGEVGEDKAKGGFSSHFVAFLRHDGPMRGAVGGDAIVFGKTFGEHVSRHLGEVRCCAKFLNDRWRGTEADASGDDSAEEFGVGKGETEGEFAAVAPADEVGVGDAQFEEKGGGVFGHELIRERASGDVGGVAVGHLFDGDDFVPAGEESDLLGGRA